MSSAASGVDTVSLVGEGSNLLLHIVMIGVLVRGSVLPLSSLSLSCQSTGLSAAVSDHNYL